MVNQPKMISLEPEDMAWINENDINASLLMRRTIEVCKDCDVDDPRKPIEKLRKVNKVLNELIAAYQHEAGK
jgi:hypothetical protein